MFGSFPSGTWRGCWQQEHYGQQEMDDFELHFEEGVVHGQGVDIVGRFTIYGDYHPQTGQISLVKQYVGRHQVLYEGQPNGEGAIIGQWTCEVQVGEHLWRTTGPFLLQPSLPKPTEHDPVIEIKPRRS